jgi:hypothetical protein
MDPQGYLLMAFKANPELWASTVGNPEFKALMDKVQPTGEASQDAATADFLRSKMSGQAGQGGQPNQPAMNALDGNMLQNVDSNGMPASTGFDVTGMNVNGMMLEDQGLKARGAYMESSARSNATRNEEMRPMRNQVNNYLTTFAEAVNEIGGLDDNALSALIKGKSAEVASQYGAMPATFTLQTLMEPTALMLGSFLNKGRPTDVDAKAAAKMLTRLSYTKGVNERLAKFLQQIINSNDKDAQSDLYWALQYDGGSRKESAKAFGSQGVEKVLNKYGFKDTKDLYKIEEIKE